MPCLTEVCRFLPTLCCTTMQGFPSKTLLQFASGRLIHPHEPWNTLAYRGLAKHTPQGKDVEERNDQIQVHLVFCTGTRASYTVLPVIARHDATAVSESPIPVITGNFSFQSTFQPGTLALLPEFDPVVLVPLGRSLLVESEFDMSISPMRTGGQWGSAVVNGFEYLQLDYMV